MSGVPPAPSAAFPAFGLTAPDRQTHCLGHRAIELFLIKLIGKVCLVSNGILTIKRELGPSVEPIQKTMAYLSYKIERIEVMSGNPASIAMIIQKLPGSRQIESRKGRCLITIRPSDDPMKRFESEAPIHLRDGKMPVVGRCFLR